MGNRTAEEIKIEINGLKHEIILIKAKSDSLIDQKISIERQERELKNRLEEIQGRKGWRPTTGRLEKLDLELKESGFPRYDEDSRIVSVTDKTIALKRDGQFFESVTRYNRETGWRSRAKTSLGSIDAKKALEILEAHNGK
jgi:hypothetical protein